MHNIYSRSCIIISFQATIRRLNTTQLFDLYRRLDVDGNGELGLPEFLKVSKMLHLEEDSDHLADIFQRADIDKTGSLTSTQFLVAYDYLITHKTWASNKNETFFEAIRYGRCGDDYLVTVYSGSVENVDTFQSLVPRMQPQRFTGRLFLLSLVDLLLLLIKLMM